MGAYGYDLDYEIDQKDRLLSLLEGTRRTTSTRIYIKKYSLATFSMRKTLIVIVESGQRESEIVRADFTARLYCHYSSISARTGSQGLLLRSFLQPSVTALLHSLHR
jgi:hypothetical protein